MSESDTSKRTGRLSGLVDALKKPLASLAPPPITQSLRPSMRPSMRPPSGVALDEERPNRAWDPKEWEEDKRYVDALDLYAAGNKRDALARLENLYRDDPGHLFAREQLFLVALELGDEEKVGEHTEWIVLYYTQAQDLPNVCKSYREARIAFPQLVWSEKALMRALIAGEKVDDARVVVDATKQLIHNYPQSASLPRAMLAGAKVQEAEGRPDLARITLQNIMAQYPLDPIAEIAKRRLVDLS